MKVDFHFNPKITKELILSKVSEEQIMEYYLHVPVKKGLFKSPLRRDNHITCSFYRDRAGNLIFKDFATGQHLGVFSVVQEIFKCSYKEALKIIANDFNIVNNNSIRKNVGKINPNPIKLSNNSISKVQVEIQDFSASELKWWGKYGITINILKHYNIYSCKHVFLNGSLFASSQQNCPIYGYYGGKIQKDNEKIELWKCYFPKRTSYRFIGNWPSKKLQGYEQLPKKGKLCVITKSMKDVAALSAYNIPACAPNSEVVIPSESIINDLKSRFEYIFVLWDNDQCGVTFINKFKRKYPELNYLIIPRKYEAKDFSDLRKKYGYKETKGLIEKYLIWYKENSKNT